MVGCCQYWVLICYPCRYHIIPRLSHCVSVPSLLALARSRMSGLAWHPVVKWSPALAMMSTLKVAKFGLVPYGSNCLEAE